MIAADSGSFMGPSVRKGTCGGRQAAEVRAGGGLE